MKLRTRLTTLYTGLFLLTSSVLLTVVNLSLGHTLEVRVADFTPAPGQLPPVPPPPFQRLPREVVNDQWIVTAIVIAALTVVSVIVGRWLAGRMVRPLQEMTARLERSVDSQRLFIANAAHELRTPLATQRAAIQIGLDDPLPAGLVEVREKLLTHNRRTERLIDSLLVLAQADHGLDTEQPVALDVLARQVAEDGVPDGITVTVQTEPVSVRGDPVLLSRLLTNLVQNAFRYNHAGGSVYIGLTRDRVLTVRNTGPEVPAERIPELFQPFRRLHTRTRSADGAGLGLSIVASIAEAHQATLTASPNLGGGLQLTVRFS